MNFLLGVAAAFVALKVLQQPAAQPPAQPPAAQKPVTVEQTTATQVAQEVAASVQRYLNVQAPEQSNVKQTTTTTDSAWNSRPYVTTGGQIRQALISALHSSGF